MEVKVMFKRYISMVPEYEFKNLTHEQFMIRPHMLRITVKNTLSMIFMILLIRLGLRMTLKMNMDITNGFLGRERILGQ